MKVLIVDDEPDIRDSLKDFFKDEGWSVDAAANGAEALDILQAEEPPDVVILDLLMPVLGGNDLYAKMQADPRLAKVPVIISTSDPSRAPSGVLIMKKPVNLDRLLETVERYGASGGAR
jgi:two-component system, sensor histidine kinase and response regulator